MVRRFGIAWLLTICWSTVLFAGEEPPRFGGLFLGDRGHHQPAQRAKQLIPALRQRGIELTYSEDLESLNRETLAQYDFLLLYANWTEIAPSQEAALLEYVEQGGGFVPLHCASYCFLNSPRYVKLVGAQFQRHGTGVFRTQIVDGQHPVMRDLPGFETWDETYVHTHHTDDRHVLQTRAEGDQAEPWTWVRKQGQGRVFYTAYGHDHRTFGNPGFHELVERGIRWASGDDRALPQWRSRPQDPKPFEYDEARLPNYLSGKNWGTEGPPISQMQRPLEPAESLKHLVVPPGFEVRLFAAEPDITKPITMAWDQQGRLWIVESTDYPNNLQPESQGADRIKVCEDTDGDGQADKFTVFADKLSIPTSLTFARGGVIVQQAPHTLFLKDVDGDLKADVREVLFTGWGTRDTHAGPSNLRYGPDNWIWGVVGYSGFDGTVGGVPHKFSMGIYRFRPDGTELEYLRTTNNNTWGLGFSEEGHVFASTANNNPSDYLAIPNRYYERVRGNSPQRLEGIAQDALFYPITENVRQMDHHGKFTAAAGHALYTARDLPRDYWNRAAFVAGPTGHLLATFLLEPRGSDFVSRNVWNFLASDDQWTAPIMAEVGPDGAIWVVDWYNFIVQHNPTPRGYETGKGNAYVTPLRDKRHGRIYRVIHRDAGDRPIPNLAGASPQQLVATLRHTNMTWRLHAQRLLVERADRDIVPALVALVEDPQCDDLGLNPGALHALWTLHGLGALDGSQPGPLQAAQHALRHPSPAVRRAALQVLPRRDDTAVAILKAESLGDADPHVRLAALLALSEMPAQRELGRAVAEILTRPENLADAWIPDAAIAAAAAQDRFFLEALSGISPSEKSSDVLSRVIAQVAEHYARGAPADSIAGVLTALSRGDAQVAQAALGGITAGWPREKPPIMDENLHGALASLLERLPVASKSRLVELATTWGDRQFEQMAAQLTYAMLGRLNDPNTPDETRADLARQLIQMRREDAPVVASLLKTITPGTGPETATALLDAILYSRADATGAALTAYLSSLTPSVRRAAVSILLRREPWTGALLDAAEAGTIRLSDLDLVQRQSLVAHPQKSIARRAVALLGRGAGLPNPDREKVIQQLLPLCESVGNATSGKAVFKKTCANCHRLHGEGTAIGPDLSGMAVHPKQELLVHILDPSRSVEGNYRLHTVVTDDGRVFSGMLASESKTSLELFDAEGKRHVLLREEVEQLEASNKSLMPEGFEKQLEPSQLSDLLEFLTQRGKYVPLPLNKVATITTVRGMFHDHGAEAERLIFDDWGPKHVGDVPFHLVDPRDGATANAIMLHGPRGKFPPTMPRLVGVPCQAQVRAIHLLSGVSGWGAKQPQQGSVSMIVRLHYADGQKEDHSLRDGVHFADYIGHFDVPESQFAFALRKQQMRYLSIRPQRAAPLKRIEFVKGPDRTAPVVMAVTVEIP